MGFGFIQYNCDCLVYSFVFELPDTASVRSSSEHPTAFNRPNLRHLCLRGKKDLFHFFINGAQRSRERDLSKITSKLWWIMAFVLWTRVLSAGPHFPLHLHSPSIAFLPLNTSRVYSYCCLFLEEKDEERGWDCFSFKSVLLQEAAASFPQAKQGVQIGLGSPIPSSLPFCCRWRWGELWCLASGPGRRREEGLYSQAYCALENLYMGMFKKQFLNW